MKVDNMDNHEQIKDIISKMDGIISLYGHCNIIMEERYCYPGFFNDSLYLNTPPRGPFISWITNEELFDYLWKKYESLGYNVELSSVMWGIKNRPWKVTKAYISITEEMNDEEGE